VPGEDAVALERVRQRASERAAEMRPALRPVGTAEGEQAPFEASGGDVDPAGFECLLAVRGHGVVGTLRASGPAGQPASLEKHVEQHTQVARDEMAGRGAAQTRSADRNG